MPGPTEFSDFEALVSNAVEGMWGQRLRVVPQNVGRFVARSNQTDRTPYEIKGVIDLHPKIVRVRAVGRTDADTPDLSSDEAHIVIRYAALGTNRQFLPQKGDKVETVGVTPTMKFHVNDPQDDGVGAVTLICAREV